MTTYIRIVNNSGIILNCQTSVSPALTSDAWSATASTIEPSPQPGTVLSFNRDQSISNGKVWIFTTSFTLAGVKVCLEEKLTGIAIGSTMAQRISAGGITTDFQDTNGSFSIQFTGVSGQCYEIGWELAPSTSGAWMDIKYTVRMAVPKVQLKRIAPVMPQIETVVMLMLENRSFDNVLGWLHKEGKPALAFPPGSPLQIDGIPDTAVNHVGDKSYRPAMGTGSNRSPHFDPGEEMKHVQVQLYADGNGNMPPGYFWAQEPTMSGFAYDYDASYTNTGEIMGAYSAAQLPAMYGLARNYAVSDRWFCSVPTQTYPNRAFSVCGTSLGVEVNSEIIGYTTYQDTRTIFTLLNEVGVEWGIYSGGLLAAGTLSTTFNSATAYAFSNGIAQHTGRIYPSAAFGEALRAGTLPKFSYLEPLWGGGAGYIGSDGFLGVQGNDYHPPAWVGPAEYHLNALYNALTASPQWKNMLFIITFDEHGGTWDHVPPPTTVPPDQHIGSSGFKFDRLGVRVPCILVSPFIPPGGMVFRSPDAGKDFDHTSFIATLLKWVGIDPASADMGARVASAPTFEGVFSAIARTDVPRFDVPESYLAECPLGLYGAPGEEEDANFGVPAAATFGSKPMDVTAFRALCDSSKSPAELHAGLVKLTTP
jgi:phospholipase C